MSVPPAPICGDASMRQDCRVEILNKKWVIPSDLESASKVKDEVLRLVAGEGYGQAATFAIKLALEEGLNNAIRHGNRGDRSKTVEVMSDIDARKLAITIVDQGRGFDPQAVPDPTADENLEKPSGRGIMLMRAYMDEVRFNPRGNRLYMVKRNK